MLSPFILKGLESPIAKMGTPTSKLMTQVSQIPGLIGWYDASDASTLTLNGNEVTAMTNRVNGGLGVSRFGALPGPLYDPANQVANGKPALVWTSEDRCLTLPADAHLSELFAVMAYQTGTETLATDYTTFFSGYTALNQWNVNRMLIEKNSSNMRQFNDVGVKSVSINGAPFGISVLPLPLSVVRFSASDIGTSISLASMGYSNSYGWNGPICEILAWSDQVTLSDTQVTQVETYLKTKWGI